MSDVVFVQMPWVLSSTPSLALGLFKSSLKTKNISVNVKYANLMLLKEKKYHQHFINAVNSTVFFLLGEFLFSDLIIGMKKKYSKEKYFEKLKSQFYFNEHLMSEISYWEENVDEYQKYLESFLDELTEEIIKEKPRIVASSSMFQQTNATMALFCRLKKIDPSIITAMGGPNCMTGAGLALVKAFIFLDYAFSGEGDEYIPIVIEKLLKGENIDNIEGVITSKTSNEKLRFPLAHNMENILSPDYDDFFENIKKYDLEENISPILFIEGSRGCWWGQKKPCTFCGLGGESRLYRQKTTEKVVSEIEYYQAKYGINKFCFSDSILSMIHVKELPKALKDKHVRLFAETKSNLKKNEMKLLADGGFTYIQPGIESLHNEVLNLMNKGNTGLKHIALLKWCRIYDIALSWNILYSFPGEKEEWYNEMNELLPLITHLNPPNGVIHIVFQKYSTYTNDPETYGLHLQAAEIYDYVYPDVPELINGIAYMFEPVDEEERMKYYNYEKDKECYKNLIDICYMWQQAFYQKYDRLEMKIKREKIEICDFRSVSNQIFLELDGVKKEIYLLSEDVAKIGSIKQNLKGKYSESEVEKAIEELTDQKLMIRINDEVLALAVQLEGYGTNNIFDRKPLGDFVISKSQ